MMYQHRSTTKVKFNLTTLFKTDKPEYLIVIAIIIDLTPHYCQHCLVNLVGEGVKG